MAYCGRWRQVRSPAGYQPPRCAGACRSCPGAREDYAPYLRQRWEEGCSDAAALWRELRERGYSRRLPPCLRLPSARRAAPAPARSAQPPKIRQVTAWNMTDPGNLSREGKRRLAAITGSCPELARPWSPSRGASRRGRLTGPDRPCHSRSTSPGRYGRGPVRRRAAEAGQPAPSALAAGLGSAGRGRRDQLDRCERCARGRRNPASARPDLRAVRKLWQLAVTYLLFGAVCIACITVALQRH